MDQDFADRRTSTRALRCPRRDSAVVYGYFEWIDSERNIGGVLLGATFLALASIASSAQTAVNQTTSGIVYAGPADGTCYNGGCAKLTTVCVHLPLDGNVTMVRQLWDLFATLCRFPRLGSSGVTPLS